MMPISIHIVEFDNICSHLLNQGRLHGLPFDKLNPESVLRELLALRPHDGSGVCCDDPNCLGWFVNSETGALERCDQCASGVVNMDAAFIVLPEAMLELAADALEGIGADEDDSLDAARRAVATSIIAQIAEMKVRREPAGGTSDDASTTYQYTCKHCDSVHNVEVELITPTCRGCGVSMIDGIDTLVTAAYALLAAQEEERAIVVTAGATVRVRGHHSTDHEHYQLDAVIDRVWLGQARQSLEIASSLPAGTPRSVSWNHALSWKDLSEDADAEPARTADDALTVSDYGVEFSAIEHYSGITLSTFVRWIDLSEAMPLVCISTTRPLPDRFGRIITTPMKLSPWHEFVVKHSDNHELLDLLVSRTPGDKPVTVNIDLDGVPGRLLCNAWLWLRAEAESDSPLRYLSVGCEVRSIVPSPELALHERGIITSLMDGEAKATFGDVTVTWTWTPADHSVPNFGAPFAPVRPLDAVPAVANNDDEHECA